MRQPQVGGAGGVEWVASKELYEELLHKELLPRTEAARTEHRHLTSALTKNRLP